MRTKPILIILFWGFLLTTNTYSQINGLSASKIFVYDAAHIQPGSFEVELCTKIFTAKQMIDTEGKTIPLNGRLFKSELDFRFTFGVLNYLEIGVQIPSEMDKFFIGTKFHFYKNSFIHIAGIAGTGYGIKSRFINEGQVDSDKYENLSAGAVSTLRISNETTIDFHVIYSVIDKNQSYQELHLAAGYGYFLSEVLQLAIEMQVEKQLTGFNKADKILLTPGITFDPAENFSVVAAFPLDIAGRNTEKGIAFFTGFTLWFD